MNGNPFNAPQDIYAIEYKQLFAPRQVGTCFE
jgi:hypothetical protein